MNVKRNTPYAKNGSLLEALLKKQKNREEAKRIMMMNNGGIGDPPKTPETQADPAAYEKMVARQEADARAEEILRRTRMGMYPDAGEGAARELSRINSADRWGQVDDENPLDFITRSNSQGEPIDELYQIYEGLKSFFSGDGYKRGYNDEYIRQARERASERIRRYHERNPDKPFGHLS